MEQELEEATFNEGEGTMKYLLVQGTLDKINTFRFASNDIDKL